jgi:hypothetical protein
MSTDAAVQALKTDPLAFVWARMENVWGQRRRLYLAIFQGDYVSRQMAKRQGDCNRCGLCCQLVFKCPSLRYEDGLAACGRYESRPTNCANFPINEADLDDVRRIAPHTACSFSFASPCASMQRSAPVAPRAP